MDSSKPVISTLRAAYYQKPKEDVNKSFMAAVQQGLAPNTDYSRYWHGSMVVLRPLFTFMDIVQIRLLLGVLAAAGIAAAVWILWREGQKVLAVSFAAGAVWVNTWMLTKCIEYVTTFLVMDAMLMILIAYLRKHTSAEARTAFKQTINHHESRFGVTGTYLYPERQWYGGSFRLPYEYTFDIIHS